MKILEYEGFILENSKKQIKKTKNWEASGYDYYLKWLTAKHQYLIQNYNRMLKNEGKGNVTIQE